MKDAEDDLNKDIKWTMNIYASKFLLPIETYICTLDKLYISNFKFL